MRFPASRLVLARTLVLAFALCVLGSAALPAATKYALVIGINHYQDESPAQQSDFHIEVSDSAQRPVRAGWMNLEGAVNDALLFRQLLISRYGFEAANIRFLTDSKHMQAAPSAETATRENILSSIRKLIADARQGDTVVIFYAGHGSRIESIVAGERYDETLVPADSMSGAADIRDKELKNLYNQILDKGATLTVIADSCHSGGISRGGTARARTRQIEGYRASEEELAKLRSLKLDPRNADERGALILSAAQDDEIAEEIETEDGPRGVFTHHFLKAIQSSAPHERVSVLFEKTLALMRSAGRQQLPSKVGDGRDERSLFGEPASSVGAAFATVKGKTVDGEVALAGGIELGFSEGTELKRVAGDTTIRLRIKERPVLGSSLAEVIGGTDAPIEPGDVFLIDRWVLDDQVATRVYVPSEGLPTLQEIHRLAGTIKENLHSVGAVLVTNPLDASINWTIRHQGAAGWRLSQAAKPESGRLYAAFPSPEELRSAMGAVGGRVFVSLPPWPALAEAITAKLNAVGSAVQVTGSAEAAHYLLVGTLDDGAAGTAVRFQWVAPGARVEDEPGSVLPLWTTPALPGADGNHQAALRTLETDAINLARVRLWLNMNASMGDSGMQFPYELVFAKEGTREIISTGEFLGGDKYKMYLRRVKTGTEDDNTPIDPRWVYVLSLDRSGKMQVLFPRSKQNSSANRRPQNQEDADVFPLSTGTWDFKVGTPYGLDTYILLVSENPVDPNLLVIEPQQREPVRSRGSRGNVEAFLFGIQGAHIGARGTGTPVPTGWSMQRITIEAKAP